MRKRGGFFEVWLTMKRDPHLDRAATLNEQRVTDESNWKKR